MKVYTRCPLCSKYVLLVGNGRLRKHRYLCLSGPNVGRMAECLGSGAEVKVDKQT